MNYLWKHKSDFGEKPHTISHNYIIVCAFSSLCCWSCQVLYFGCSFFLWLLWNFIFRLLRRLFWPHETLVAAGRSSHFAGPVQSRETESTHKLLPASLISKHVQLIQKDIVLIIIVSHLLFFMLIYVIDNDIHGQNWTVFWFHITRYDHRLFVEANPPDTWRTWWSWRTRSRTWRPFRWRGRRRWILRVEKGGSFRSFSTVLLESVF